MQPNIPSPRLRRFELRGLYGYKTLAINCNDFASIVLAENGVGKTTLLNALYALLSGRTSRLASMDFSEAILEFEDETLRFDRNLAFKNDPQSVEKVFRRSGMGRELLGSGVSREELFELMSEYVSDGPAAASRHAIFRRLYRDTPFDEEELMSRLERIKGSFFDQSYVTEFRTSVTRALKETQVLYLPTYRRIEVDLPEVSANRPPRARMHVSESDPATNSDQLIYFGLADVEQKLTSMTRRIQQSIVESYSKLSGNVIDTLLGTEQLTLGLRDSLDVETIRLMLARLGKRDSATERRLEQLISSQELLSEMYQPLAYFLRQLSETYEASRDEEGALEEFVRIVNQYLDTAEGEKRFNFDKFRLQVEIRNTILDKPLPFGSLSSGEKQIVSVFSRLILDRDRRYIILIDEPELSLSIEWQRKFLPDILKTNTCAQLIAITHSPFVFENELDAFARPLEIDRVARQ